MNSLKDWAFQNVYMVGKKITPILNQLFLASHWSYNDKKCQINVHSILFRIIYGFMAIQVLEMVEIASK